MTYADLTARQKIYFFEFLLAEAARAVFVARQINAATRFTPPAFQKDRPRAEIIFTPGAGQGRFVKVNGVPR
jgi:hypothetical protein